MPSNSQKVPLVLSLNQAMSRASESRVQQIGKCLPCSVVSVDGAMITVKFEINADPLSLPQVKMPLFGPEYVRYPIQAGDKGFAISADAYLGQMSGLGSGTADFSQQPNLSTLAFMPCGNTGWRSVDSNAVVIYGPNGVVLQDADQTCTITLTPTGLTIDLGSQTFSVTSGAITVNTAGQPVTFNMGGATFTIDGNLRVTGSTIGGFGGADAINIQTHHHSGIQAGAAQSGPPVAGT
ncbi:MAG TPA: hypothetical protein VGM38_09295 [Pseudolysinimonas sp.]|jgi:hypothetical protein